MGRVFAREGDKLLLTKKGKVFEKLKGNDYPREDGRRGEGTNMDMEIERGWGTLFKEMIGYFGTREAMKSLRRS